MILSKGEEISIPSSEADLLQMVRVHWQKHRPTTFDQLQKKSYLEEAIQTAVSLTLTSMDQLIQQHSMAPWEAWELVREEWALLPAEERPEMDPEDLPFLLDIEALEADPSTDVVIVVDSPGITGFAWLVSLERCLEILGRSIGRK